MFEEVHGNRLLLRKYQHAEKVVSDNMGLTVSLAVMATGFYHLLACQESKICWENNIVEEIPISEVL